MTALASVLGLFLLFWGVTRLAQEVKRAPEPQGQIAPSDDLSRLRDRFALEHENPKDNMSLEEFERQANEILSGAGSTPIAPLDAPGGSRVPTSTRWDRTEIHVHNAPPGSSLHIRLP